MASNRSLCFKLPKCISVVNKHTLRAKGVEADIGFTFCTSVAVSNRRVLWNKAFQPLIPLHWFCCLLHLHYSCTCSIKLLMLIWHTASIKIYKVQHNSAILKANKFLKKQANVHIHFCLKCKFNNTIGDQYNPIFPRLKIKKNTYLYSIILHRENLWTKELSSDTCHVIKTMNILIPKSKLQLYF